MPTPAPESVFERYVTVDEICAAVSMSRSSFYRLLADPESGLAALVIRIPPPHGRLRVPVGAFLELLRHASRRTNRRRPSRVAADTTRATDAGAAGTGGGTSSNAVPA